MSMAEIQKQLKVPKSQFNGFGKYKYRSCEDIVEAVKPVLAGFGYHLNMTDSVIAVGDRIYVKATCMVVDGTKVIAEASAFAREADEKKGMDASQITGTASSYARKYALNGLFAIDDTKDADTDEYANQVAAKKPDAEHVKKFEQCSNLNELQELWSVTEDKKLYEQAKNDAKKRIGA